MVSVQAVLVFVGRTGLGIVLAIVLSMVGMGIAWGLFVFFGARSLTTLLSLFMVAGGIGAGLGGFLPWLRLERNPLPVLITTMLLVVLAGVVGAWGGYQFGAHQEVTCCAKPDITPLAYTGVGAAVVANVVSLALVTAREITPWRW
jgi:hypothetical protein